eukprot:scaffold1690_cov182-Amphora_coffeaeformis.AAC.57
MACAAGRIGDAPTGTFNRIDRLKGQTKPEGLGFGQYDELQEIPDRNRIIEKCPADNTIPYSSYEAAELSVRLLKVVFTVHHAVTIPNIMRVLISQSASFHVSVTKVKNLLHKTLSKFRNKRI